jgi:serine/threonine-protein kinase
MVSTSDGFQIWSETYERQINDLFVVQELLAKAIVTAMRPQFENASNRRFTIEHTSSIEAYRMYLKGRYRVKETRGALLEAIDYFQAAIRLDSEFAAAYAEMAWAHILLGNYNFAPPNQIMPKAKEYTRRALELDPASSAAHSYMAAVLWSYEWDWAGAKREYERAIALSPGDAVSRALYGLYLMQQLRMDESLTELRRAEQLDPLSPLVIGLIGSWFLSGDQLESVLEYHQNALHLNPRVPLAYLQMGRAYVQLKKPEQAKAVLKKAIEMSGNDPAMIAELANTYALLGDRAKAEGLVQQLTGANSHPPAFEIACTFAALGENDRAFEWLERAYQERQGNLIWLRSKIPCLAGLRSDPRFASLLSRMNLPLTVQQSAQPAF